MAITIYRVRILSRAAPWLTCIMGGVRFLFTFCGGSGHFLPTLPIARAVVARGHLVAYACQDAMRSAVEASGFAAFETGGSTLLPANERRPLVPVDRRAEEEVVGEGFAGRTARDRAPRLRSLASDWQPDVIVRDEMDFGAAVAAEVLGMPHAAVLVIAAGGLVRPDVVGDSLKTLRAAHGLDDDPELRMLHRYLTLVPVPPSYRDPRDPLPATAQYMCPAVVDTREALADDASGSARPARARPMVYVTLGTVFPQESGDLFIRIVAGVRDLPVDVVVTVGRELDPAELGKQPPNVRVEQFLPQASVLANCDAVVSHAGSGSVMGALAFGLPSVLLPIGADQPLNADRCVDLGVGRALDSVVSTPIDIAHAVAEVLSDTSYRNAATRIRDEINALPGSEHAADLLEQLVSGGP
jgi:UDP:flavonoid glycosyltransferase YjiC (YdhE family)